MSKQKKDKTVLKLSQRKIFGKKVKKIRREGKIPANIFGQNFKSTPVTIDTKLFLQAYRTNHKTGIIYLQLNKKEIPALIKNLQIHPVSGNVLHVDFRKIDLKKEIETSVPIKIIGESEAVSQKGGVLIVGTKTLLLKALPSDIPSSIDIDISTLKEVGQEIKISDLSKSKKFTILDPQDKVVVSITAHKEEEIKAETEAETEPQPETEKEKPLKEEKKEASDQKQPDKIKEKEEKSKEKENK